MNSDENDKIIAFDTLFSTNHIQMLKVMLPYMDNQMQKFMAVYIKFSELNYTIDFYKKNPCSICGCMERNANPDFMKMFTELLPFCTAAEKNQIEQMRTIFQSMEMYKEMSKTMELMKDFMPDMASFAGFPFPGANSAGSSTSTASEDGPNNASSDFGGFPGSGSFDMMNLLMNMLTPEQKQMFELFGGNHHDE